MRQIDPKNIRPLDISRKIFDEKSYIGEEKVKNVVIIRGETSMWESMKNFNAVY